MNITLIRGLARDKYHWGPFPDSLRQTFRGSAIEMLDLPGNGEWSSVLSPLTPRGVVNFLRQHSCFVQRGQTTHLIAVSLGAMISYQWAKTYPQDIDSMVLINTSLLPSPAYHRMTPKGLIKMLDAALTRDAYLRERKVLELTTNLLGSRLDTIARQWADHSLTNSTTISNLLRQLAVAAQMKREKNHPPVKTLLLSSKADALVNPKATETIARAWGAPHKIHPTAGHDLTLDALDWSVKQLEEFYNSL